MSLTNKLPHEVEHDDAPANADAPGAAASESAAGAPAAGERTHESGTAGEEWWESSAPIAEDAVRANEPEVLPVLEVPADEVPAAPANFGTRPLVMPDEDSGTRPLTGDDLPALATLRSQRGFAFAALRDIGRVRAINQDSIFAMQSTLPREGNDLPFGLFMVADGMGGHQGGEIASRLAISTVVQIIMAELVIPALTDSSTEALQPLIIEAVQTANRTIWENAKTLGSDMGTTCTVALMLGHGLYLGHVGDTRAYLATPTGLRLLTTDHSTVGRLIQVGQLAPSEAREHPLRSQLYRTVGQQPEVLVDFSYQQLGDATHLLLASDGLWGLIDDDILLDVIEHHHWPQDACNELIARANLAGGDDNISAIIVSLPSTTP